MVDVGLSLFNDCSRNCHILLPCRSKTSNQFDFTSCLHSLWSLFYQFHLCYGRKVELRKCGSCCCSYDIMYILSYIAIVLVLTLYAIFTPTDFTVKWGIIFVVLMAMLMFGIFTIILWSPILNNLYCCLGVILFGIYLVIDTQLIIGGRRL